MRGASALLAMMLMPLMMACGDPGIAVTQHEGVGLESLDFGAPPPRGLTLNGPDDIVLQVGNDWDVSVAGSPELRGDLRFSMADGTLLVTRADDTGKNGEPLTVTVTMPAPDSVSLTGSGTIRIPALAEGGARVTIAGSGQAIAPDIQTAKLDVRIGGAGSFVGSGRARSLNLDIAGSGTADMAAMSADVATIGIMGSGTGRFASDGTVSATIVGPGRVEVSGDARCDANRLGSGQLVCGGR